MSDSNANGDSAGDRTILNPAGGGLNGQPVNFVCNAGAGGATSIVTDPATCGSGDDSNIVRLRRCESDARFIQAWRVGQGKRGTRHSVHAGPEHLEHVTA